MTTSKKIGALAVSLLAAFAAGRWAAPTKVVTQVKTVEIENKTDKTKSDTGKDRHQETTVTEVTRPDGTKEKTTKTVTDTQTNTKVTSAETDKKDVESVSTKEVTRDSSKVTLSALAGAQLSFSGAGPIVYGGAITKPILGPVTVGVWGLSSGTGGFSAGLTF